MPIVVRVWCDKCGEFHTAKKDDEYYGVYTDKCGHTISVRIESEKG